MNKYPIFYVIHGQFFENSKSNEKKLNKITLIFKNKKPKELRAIVLRKFAKIKSEFLIQTGASAPVYQLRKNKVINSFIDSIENVPFFTEKSHLNLALTLSMGIKKDDTLLYKSENYIDYPYNKNLYPIAAVGHSLYHVEDSLKINLLLEKKFYEYYKAEFPKINMITNFIDNKVLKDYILDSLLKRPRSLELHIQFIKRALSEKEFDFFPTNQFYNITIKLNNKEGDNSISFTEKLSKKMKYDNLEKFSNIKKELHLLTPFCKAESLRYPKIKKDILYYNHTELKGFLNRSFTVRKSFFSQKQLQLHTEMSKINFPINDEGKEMRRMIKKWL